MNEYKETKTADDAILNLFETPLFNVEFSLDKALGVLGLLEQKYFETTQDSMESDTLQKHLFESGYSEIQTLLSVIYDYILKASEDVGGARNEYYKIFDAQSQTQPGKSA
jgi:hypothetical protein